MNIKEPHVGISMLSLQTDRVYRNTSNCDMVYYIVYSLCPRFSRYVSTLYEVCVHDLLGLCPRFTMSVSTID